MLSRKLTRSIAAGVATVAVVAGGVALGNSSSGNGARATAKAAQPAAIGHGAGRANAAAGVKPPTGAKAPAGAPVFGETPPNWRGGTGTIITGASADKAKAAAIAADYSGTVNRVMKLNDGSYAVHMFGTEGPHHVFVDKDFKVTAAQ
jgi:hypothetical protein